MELRRHFGVRAILALATALLAITAAFGVLATPAATNAAQTVPYKINFQGRLTDNSGNILADGSYNIRFRFFDAVTLGNNEWQEDRVITGTDRRVTVQNGLFNIQFGDFTALTPALFNRVATGDLWLEVELPTPATASCATNGCAVFTEGPMTPRQPLAAAPYAFNADALDGLDADAFVQLSGSAQTGSINISGTATVATLGAANSTAYLCHNGTSQIAACSTTGVGAAVLQGGNSFGAAADIGSNDNALNLRANNATRLTVTTGGDLTFVQGGNRTLSVAQASSGAGNNLTIQAGQSGTGANNGGNLILQAGATGGSGATGSVIIRANGTDSTSAFQVQNAAQEPALTIDTTANKVTIGNSTGTNTDTTLLVTDTATADPTTGYNGAIYYNSTSGTLRCYQGGVWVNCVTLPVTASSNSTASFTSGLNNVTANQTGLAVETIMFVTNTTVSTIVGATGFTAPAAGSFRSCLIKNQPGNVTAGTLNLRWRVNGASVGSGACTMSTTNPRQSATALDNGAVTFAQGDTIGIAFDTNAAYAPATLDYTVFWTVEYNSTSGNGITMQFTYDNSSSPATVNLADGKNMVWNAADTATDPSYLINLQCTTSCSTNGRFAVQNGGTDVFTVSPNNGGIALAQSATFTSTAILSRNGAGTGDSTLRVTGTPINDATSSLVRIGNAIAGGNAATDGGTYLGINAPASGAGSTADFLNLQSNGASRLRVNSFGDHTTTFTALNGTSTTNGTGTSSTTLILTSAANFDIGNYVQVNSANCGGTGVNPCYAKITNKVTNTLTITPALTWANAQTVNEYHLPEIGATNTTSTLANRYGRGYFIAGVAAGNGTTFYNEDSIETDLTTFELLNTNVTNLSIGGAATTVSLGAAGATVTIPGTLEVTGSSDLDLTGGLTIGTGEVITVGSTPGVTASCSGGQVLDGQTTLGGVVTGGTCVTPVGGSGANTTLSNLGVTAINTSLISDTTNTDDLGTSSTTWRTGYFGTSLQAPLVQSAAATALTITANANSTWSTSGAGALTIQSGSGTLSLGSTTTLTAGGALAIDSATTNDLDLGTTASAKTVTIGNITGATGLVLDAGTGGVNIGDNATTKTIDIGGVTASGTDTINIATNSTAADTVNIGNTGGATALVFQAGSGNITLNTSTGNKVIVGSATTDTTQVLIQLDSYAAASSDIADTATCATTTNQGALYYNTATAAIRTCLNGGWEDVVSTAALGLLLFGVVPDSGANPGDVAGATGAANGPCKVSFATTTTVNISACVAYSGGRKIISAAQTGLSVAGNGTKYICMDTSSATTDGQPAVAAALPTFSAATPMLCLAQIVVAANVIADIYDLRTFTSTSKQFATINSATTTPGMPVVGSTARLVVTSNTAAAPKVRGVIVATSGNASTNTVNGIIATDGLAWVRATAGTANDYVQNNSTGFVITVANAPAPANGAFAALGTAQTTFISTCSAANNCDGSLLVNLNLR